MKAALPYVDSHSAFFTKESYKSTLESTSGEFSGIGIVIISKNPEDESLAVIDVVQGGPAYKAGIKAGDKIIEVDGTRLRGLSSDEVINKIKGEKGTEVELRIIRKKKPMKFKIKRGTIKDQHSTCYHFKKFNIYYMSLKMFAATSAKQVEKLLLKTLKSKTRGIIFDLRRNPGGTLDAVVEMCELFLKKGSVVVTTKNRDGKTTATHKTKRDPIFKESIPIVVLVDNFTASASEILSGCLKYYSEKGDPKDLMVFIVGTQTFGKGSVQEVIPLGNGCALKLTTLLYYLPNGESIQATGIEPDFKIESRIIPEEEIKWIYDMYGKETALKNHIKKEETIFDEKKREEAIAERKKREEEEKKKKEEEENDENIEKKWKENQIKQLSRNSQVQAAINIINLIAHARKHAPEAVKDRKSTINYLKTSLLMITATST